MTRVEPITLSISGLDQRLESARQEMDARALLAVDPSGNVRGIVPADAGLDVPTLAALGVAQLAATLEILRLAGRSSISTQIVILDYPGGAVLLSTGESHLTFIAVLPEEGVLGLARLEMERLARLLWEEGPCCSGQMELADLAEQILGSAGRGL